MKKEQQEDKKNSSQWNENLNAKIAEIGESNGRTIFENICREYTMLYPLGHCYEE